MPFRLARHWTELMLSKLHATRDAAHDAAVAERHGLLRSSARPVGRPARRRHRAQPRADPRRAPPRAAGRRGWCWRSPAAPASTWRSSRARCRRCAGSRPIRRRRTATASAPGSARPPSTTSRDPVALDVESWPWPVTRADAILNINMIHIAPWSAAEALFQGAARVLPAGGVLFLYGPFKRGRRCTPRRATSASTSACAARIRAGACATWSDVQAVAAATRASSAPEIVADAGEQPVAGVSASASRSPRPVCGRGLGRGPTCARRAARRGLSKACPHP